MHTEISVYLASGEDFAFPMYRKAETVIEEGYIIDAVTAALVAVGYDVAGIELSVVEG